MIQRASDETSTNTIKLTRSLQLTKPVLTSDGVFSNNITLNNSFLVLDFQNLPELYYNTDTDTYHFELGTSGTGTAISILDNGSLVTSSVSSIDFTGGVNITTDPLDSSILTIDINQSSSISVLDNGSLLTTSLSSIDFINPAFVVTSDPLDSSIISVDLNLPTISILDNGSLVTSNVSSIDFTGPNVSTTPDPLDSSIVTVNVADNITIDSTSISSGTAGRVLFESVLNQVSESANLTWDNTNSLLQIGVDGATQGGLVLAGSTSGLLTIQANPATTDYTLTLPSVVGSQNQIPVLVDNTGTLEFTDDFYFQTTPPSPDPIKLGTRWIDSDTGLEYVWVYDGVNYLWMQPSQFGGIRYASDVITTSTKVITTFGYAYYGVTYTGGVCTITLPPGSSPLDDGKIISIADEVGGISKYNRGILIQGSGGQLINGETSVLLKIEKMSLTFLYRNSSWKTI